MSTRTHTKPGLTLDDLRAEPAAISIERAGQYFGVGRSGAYAMVREGRLPTILIGTKRMRVATAVLLRMLGGAD
ncbi:DNA-binding protein [Mycobacterium sp.]|uniref:DNA-binding protein n=1 Tax=Mycobacterium sp. TaxID=1785 RepID=UPI003F99C713